jgi:hypothetical protein
LHELFTTKFFKFGTGKTAVVIFTFSKSVTINLNHLGLRKNTFAIFNLDAETTVSTGVAFNINTGFLFEVGYAEFNYNVVEVFTTQVSVTICGQNLENTTVNFQEGDIKTTTSKIKDKNVAHTLALLVKTIGNSSSGGLIDDTLDLKTSNGAGILGSLTL